MTDPSRGTVATIAPDASLLLAQLTAVGLTFETVVVCFKNLTFFFSNFSLLRSEKNLWDRTTATPATRLDSLSERRGKKEDEGSREVHSCARSNRSFGGYERRALDRVFVLPRFGFVLGDFQTSSNASDTTARRKLSRWKKPTATRPGRRTSKVRTSSSTGFSIF